MENKIHNNISLQTLIWNKMPNPNSLIQKTDFDAKTAEIGNKIPGASNLGQS